MVETKSSIAPCVMLLVAAALVSVAPSSGPSTGEHDFSDASFITQDLEPEH